MVFSGWMRWLHGFLEIPVESSYLDRQPARDTARSSEGNSGAGPALTQDTGRSETPDQPDDRFHYEQAMMD
jgi:hypothetical protein